MAEKIGTGKKRKITKLTYRMRKKLLFTFSMFLLLFVCVVGWLVFTVYVKGDTYKKRMLSQQTYVSNVIPYRRGSIMDRKGVILARSVAVYNLVLEPKTVLKREETYRRPTLEAINKFFGISLEELDKVMEEKPDSFYVLLKKDISYDEMTEFTDYVTEFNKEAEENRQPNKEKITGYWFEKYYKRQYPLGEVASDILGFTNSGDVGNWGIEEYYNDKLNGKNGRKYGYFNSTLELEETELEAKNGLNIVSTIDSDAQKMTEDIIKKYMKSEGAENLGVIIMNPNDGEIYVMASDKEYDLNEPRKLDKYYKSDEISKMTDNDKLEALNGIWRNYCISDMYEPGSTFKPFTVSACLDQGVVKENSNYSCDGFEEVAGETIRCVKREGHGIITLSESLEFSCNDVMMQISRKLGRKDFSRYQALFGLGSRTGIDLPGESVGLTYSEDKLNPVELATNSFGQGVSVTMLQMAAGFSSIVNGGTYYRPRIVKEMTNDAGLVIEKNEPVVMKKTVTGHTASFIREALYKTVEEGTAKKAKAAGYRVAGKTGTAQKIDKVEGVGNVRSDTNYVLSFIGCVPYDSPEAVIYVVVDEPHVAEQEKSSAATALAGEIISKVFPVIGIYPEKNE